MTKWLQVGALTSAAAWAVYIPTTASAITKAAAAAGVLTALGTALGTIGGTAGDIAGPLSTLLLGLAAIFAPPAP